MDAGVIFEFEGHTLDVELGRLWHGRDEIALRPKSLALLKYFLEHPGRVIDKEELIASVWPGVTVSDDSLSQCLKDIRAALGPLADGFLRTVPRRGYVVDDKRICRRDRHASDKITKPLIEILPFRPLADDREHLWFAEGIVEDVTVALSKSRRLTVIPRYGSPPDVANADEAKRAHQVDGAWFLLKGAVRLAADSVRVSAQLIEARTGALIWADQFDRRLADIFSIQDDITDAIVKHLEVELLPDEWHAIQHARTDDIEAYTYYRHGRQLARHLTESYLRLARRMFVKSAEIDPAYARAYTGIVLCDCYLMEWHATEQTPEAILAMADKALRLDALLPEAHAARGFALYRSGNMGAAQASYDRAMQIDPRCYEALVFAGLLASVQGRRNDAKRLFINAADARHQDFMATCFVLGMTDRDSPERIHWARLVFERAERVATLQPENPAPLSRGAVGLAFLGDSKRAASWIVRAITIDPEDLTTQYNAAAVYSILGDLDKAIQILEAYMGRVAEDLVEVVRHDGCLEGIRQHPRYTELLSPSADIR